MTIRAVLAFCILAGLESARAQEPRTLWSVPVDSAVQPAPLVAELDGGPGLETIVTTAAGRQLVCLRANGQEAWRLEPPFAEQMSAAPALSDNAADGLRIAAAFGHEIVCIDPAGPRVDWSHVVEDGPVHSVHWADADGDTWHDLVAATASAVYVFDAHGDELFVARGEPGEPLAIGGPIALADAGLHGYDAIFGAGARGVFSLDDRGIPRWQAAPDTAFAGAPIVADTNADTFAEVYAVAPMGPFLYALDADLGDVLWKTWLPGAAMPGMPVIATGDLDGDGVGEVLVGLPNGHVFAVAATGEVLWSACPGEAAPLALAVGDVDGNGLPDVLAASMDGHLYALSGQGILLWRLPTGRALTHPPVITDVDQDGITDLVFAGRDGYVRAISPGARYQPRRIPWPEAGGGPARTYALLTGGEDHFDDFEAHGPALINDSEALLPLARFDHAEDDGSPLGWTRIAGQRATLALDIETKLTGQSSLRVEAREEACVIVSELVPVSDELQGVSGSVSARGTAADRAAIQWLGDAGLVREDALEAGPPQEDGWRRFALAKVAPPAGARWLTLILTTGSGETVWWDAGQVTGDFERLPMAGVFYNQVGYEKAGPKHFTAWSNHQPRVAAFELLNENNAVVHRGNLGRPERIHDAYGRAWENYYARGDFSSVEDTGTFRLRVRMDDTVAESEPFDVGEELLWERLIPAALQYIEAMESGTERGPLQGAWHLDDARDPESGDQLDLAGGWYDDGRFAKLENVETLAHLADAWEVAAWRLRDTAVNPEGMPPVSAAIAHGAAFVRKLATAGATAYAGVAAKTGYIGHPGQQTDNQPGTGDERRAVVGGRDDDLAYALAAASLATEGAHTDVAARLVERAQEAGVRTPALFSAAMQLYQQTGEEDWGAVSTALQPGPTFSVAWFPFGETIAAYEDEFITAMSVQLANDMNAFAEALLSLANNPFGVVTYGPPGNTHFFAPQAVSAEEAVGNTAYLLRMALAVARAHRFAPTMEYKTFIHDQINWLLGNNPAGISLMEGLGHTHLPAYHSHLVFGGVNRGAVSGGIANGFVPRGTGDGRPHLDLRAIDLPDWRTNACATKNAAALIAVIAHYKRASYLRMRAPQ